MTKNTSVKTERWESTNGHSPVSVFLNAVHPIRKEIFEIIDRETFPVTILKGKFLLKPGNNTGEYIYLIIKGVIRAYIKEEGKEITTWINEENEIVGSIRSLGLYKSSDEYLQAIEDTELIGIPYRTIEHLYDTYPEANIIGRKILEESYRDAEERAYISRIPSAEKKYKRFIDTRPQLVNRVSLKYIASYLGMTLETLSRVRGRL
ncbi:MAG: Crp/Fnr family transcriptional regulator [Bacteroidetes bacterium]|nr:Crp/Fnr family transcriptional regulator [Bacteroidota bacterium]MBS1608028.1 Crp/Fnr family transcriptional regulator [Bacteroidota bacterium]